MPCRSSSSNAAEVIVIGGGAFIRNNGDCGQTDGGPVNCTSAITNIRYKNISRIAGSNAIRIHASQGKHIENVAIEDIEIDTSHSDNRIRAIRGYDNVVNAATGTTIANIALT